MKRLFLIDGHALIFKMYYAFLRRPMVNSKGVDTSIIYGFTKYLLELLRKERPSHMAVAFDPPAKTFRHEMYPEYKANRSAAPELVKEALEPLTEIVTALGIPVVMRPGFEADDVIGSMAKRAAREGYDVYMVTPDKDLGQIIDDHIWQYKPGKQGGDDEIIGKKELCATMGISNPLQIIDILSIWGDAADNIKGVCGVGEVGAKKLVAKYGSMEGILEHLGELPAKQKASFEEARAHLPMSKALATIKTDLDIVIDDKELEISCNSRISEILDRYEMNSLRKILPKEESDKATTVVKATYTNTNTAAATTAVTVTAPVAAPDKTTTSTADTDKAAAATKAKKVFSVGEVTPKQLSVKDKVSLSYDRQTLILSTGDRYAVFTPQQAANILTDSSIRKVGYSMKADIVALLEQGIEVQGEIYDIELMHYILNPERTHKLESLTKVYLDMDLESPQPAEEAKKELDLFSFTEENTTDSDSLAQRARHCAASLLLEAGLREELSKKDLLSLYTGIEMPLIKVLAFMEKDGVKIDPAQLSQYSATLTAELAGIESEARRMVDEPLVNLASPRQVGAILYEKLALKPKVKKSKTGSYPTDEESLNEIKDKHPFVVKVLEYRATRKLISTYLEPLPALINPGTGKIHTTFNQALTATGRLSSVKPNLQNIPIRSERGREIRKAFVPSAPDGFIVSADYSQIELRIMAHLSQDPTLVEGFRHGADIHTETASKIFHIAFEEVTKEQRRRAKVANFGIIYGISPFGLAQRMDIPRSEAKEFITKYFEHFPKVKEYMDHSIELARTSGCATTIFGRRRYLPDINSRNQTVRSLAERNAINAPIQGSAADIIKMAMIGTAARLSEKRLRSRMVLQVHDELVFDVVAEELDELMNIVKNEMECVCSLTIPLSVECNYGKNWLEAH